MTPEYGAQANQEQVAEAMRFFEFVGGNTSDAMRIAINKATPKVRTLASAKLREQVRLQAGYVKDKLAIRKATKSNLSGAIRAEKRGLLLSRFSTDAQVASDGIRWLKPPNEPSGGIRVKVKPSGSPKAVSPGAGGKPFYIVLKTSRALGIARRTGPRRNDLEVLHGPSVSQVFDDVRGDIQPQASEELTKQVIDAMRYLMLKQYPPEPTDE